jgi:hypothetical protein
MFVRRSPLFALCAPPAGPVSQALVRRPFALNRLDRGNGAEFCLPHGELLRLLRSCGFGVEDWPEGLAEPEPELAEPERPLASHLSLCSGGLSHRVRRSP